MGQPVPAERKGRGRPQAVTSEEVLDAARKMLSEKSAASFSIRRLADSLSVTPGVLHARFGTKNELLARVYLSRLQELHQQFLRRPEGGGTLEELLRDLSLPLSDLREDFALRFEVEGGPAQGVSSTTWKELREAYLKLVHRVYLLIGRAAAAEGHALIGGSLAERLAWSLLSSGTSERNARVYGHRNAAYFRFLARSVVAALGADARQGRPGGPPRARSGRGERS